MGRRADQLLALLVLAGGAVALGFLLVITLPYHDSLLGSWFAATLEFLTALTEHRFIALSTFGPDHRYEIATIAIFFLSFFSSYLLALRTLLKGSWRELRRLRVILRFPQLLAVLLLVSGAVMAGSLLWYMDYCNFGLAWSWFNANLIVIAQLTDRVSNSYIYSDLQIRSGQVTMVSFALSYLFALILAVATLLRRRPAPTSTP